MTPRILAALLALTACATPDHPTAPEVARAVVSATPPSILVILLDDATFTQTTRAELPRTWARIADSGTVFQRGYVNTPWCCPSRSTLLTGLYPRHHGVYTNGGTDGGARKFNDAQTVFTALQGAGYTVGAIGKYLNRYDLVQPRIPPGIDEWRVAASQNFDFYNYSLLEKAFDSSAVTYRTYGTGASNYQTSVLTRHAVNFVSRVPATQPLFLLLAPYAPHGPSTPAPQDVGACAANAPYRPPAFDEVDVSDQPYFIRQLPRLSATQIATQDARYRDACASLRGVDRMVDSVLTALGERPTVVFFLSDNGYFVGEHRMITRKQSVFEEGVHIPFLVKGPGVPVGVNTSSFVSMADITPTVLSLAGASSALTMDGRDMTPLFTNPLASGFADVYLEHLAPSPSTEVVRAMRNAQWMYAEYQNGNRALYDMALDPWQMRNVAYLPAYASVRKTLAARLAALRAN